MKDKKTKEPIESLPKTQATPLYLPRSLWQWLNVFVTERKAVKPGLTRNQVIVDVIRTFARKHGYEERES